MALIPRKTRLQRFVEAMGIKPGAFMEAADRVARRMRIASISRQHYGRLRAGTTSATAERMLLVVATLRSLTGLLIRASDVFEVEPPEAASLAAARPVWLAAATLHGPVRQLPISSQRRGLSLRGKSVSDFSDHPSATQILEVLYTEHAALLRTTAKLRFGIPDADIDALVNDVFLSYLERQPRVDDPRAYLLGAIGNASKHYWRKRRHEEPLLPKHDSKDDATERGLERWILHLSIGATLAQLGEKCRETLSRFYNDEQPASIAKRLETSPGYVRQLLHTCRKRARDIYRRLTQARS